MPLSASMLAIAIIAYATALPTNWFQSARVTGTILSSPVHAWIVDDDGFAHFRRIQEAINAANPGDTIYVHNGTYWERIVVNKAVRIIGEDKFSTIIDADWAGGGVVIRADDVFVNGFTIRNSGYYCWGVRIESQRTAIIDNIILNNFNGIEVVDSCYNTISNNTITNNWRAIMLGYASNNVLSGNNITDNGEGMDIGPASGNIIYHNNFINNALEIKDGYSANIWDDGYPSGGNYWSDYTGVDEKNGPNQELLGSDGIGDAPYIINENNRDFYPLMNSWPPIRDIAVSSVTPSTAETYVGWTVNVSIVVRNEGTRAENFTVICKYELEEVEHLIGKQTITNLVLNTNTSLIFTWKTTEVTIHAIKVEIPPLTGEIDIDDNTMKNPITVKVKMLGDVNGDRIIDIFDVVLWAKVFGTQPRDPAWNPQADLYQDNTIDIFDGVIISQNFGKTYP